MPRIFPIIWLFLFLMQTRSACAQQPAEEVAKGYDGTDGDNVVQLIGFGQDLEAGKPAFRIDSVKPARLDEGLASLAGKEAGLPFPATWAQVVQLLNHDPSSYRFLIRLPLANHSEQSQPFSLYLGSLNYIDAWLISSADTFHAAGGSLRPPIKGTTLIQRQFTVLPLLLPSHWSGYLLVSIRQFTEDYSFGALRLYAPSALRASFAEEYERDQANSVFQWLFQGFMLFQLLYMLFQWLLIRRSEYGYYFGYIAVLALYFMLKFENRLGLPLLFTHFPILKIYLGRTLLIFPYFLYFRFIRAFLEIPLRFPSLNKWIIPLENFLLGYLAFDFCFIMITFDQQRQDSFFIIILLAVFVLSTSFIIYLFRYRRTLIYFVLTGSLLVATGNIAGLLISYLENVRNLQLGINNVLIFSQIGVLLEMICFTAGLAYKRHISEKEKIEGQERLIQQLQTNELLQSRMQHIRNKIAQDLHDDIGSTLSSISILSDLVLKEGQTTNARHTIGEIKDSSLLLMERMDDIVWSINPRNDSLEGLLMRVRHFATTLFEARDIEYQIYFQKNLDQLRLPMDYRQHIYLILKEAINNLVKYAEASQAFIEVKYEESVLELEVRDNGKGFDPTRSAAGNGLPGMQRRADLMGARLEVRSSEGKGTSIILRAQWQ